MNKKQLDRISIENLLEVMAALRDPHNGCPWDLEQTPASIAPHTIEEAYEVADAIERGASDELRGELGDLLFHVVYFAQMAKETGDFEFGDVVRGITEKMTRRHPHVFGEAKIRDAQGQTQQWEARKARERAAAGRDRVLDAIPTALPGLTRAAKLGRRASSVGFDWPDAIGVRAKVDEELTELDEAVGQGPQEAILAEMGDVFFALANLCRHLDIDPEQAVRGANRRFESRFAFVEARVQESGGEWSSHTLEELDAHWNSAKAHERKS